MAGIFANVDSDINKLRQLKAEIENIKKALKSINVKVDIDIAKGMKSAAENLLLWGSMMLCRKGESIRSRRGNHYFVKKSI